MQRSEVLVTGIVIAHAQNNELICVNLHGIIVPDL
jgi:hypothetical protein